MRVPLVAVVLCAFTAYAAPLPADAPTMVTVQSGTVKGVLAGEKGSSTEIVEVEVGPGDLCMNAPAAQKVSRFVDAQSRQVAGLEAENAALTEAVNKAITDPPIRPGPVIAAGVGAAVLAAVVAVLITVAVKK